jgi:hypothetical protein
MTKQTDVQIMKAIEKRIRAEIKDMEREIKNAAKGNEGRLYGYAANCEARKLALANIALVHAEVGDPRRYAKKIDTIRKTREKDAKIFAKKGQNHGASDAMHEAWALEWVLLVVEEEAGL